jgi:demethylmenaquinone methyltransferase/2-methoxy-6-polyprenyl-1,4-benzoquinol methylase
MNTTTTAKNPKMVKSMFASVAHKYDRANSILSMGIHHLWRAKLVKLANPKKGQKVLDCATGTGDLALAFKKAVGSQGEVIGTDFCKEMLSYAPQKAQVQGLNVQFELADVMNLPYPDSMFDFASISFGIRNVADPKKAIAEMARVVKPGGKILILEFGQMNFPVLGSLYTFYSERVLPKIGGWVTGDEQAYHYLQKSSAQFPCRESFVNLMKESARFAEVKLFPLSLGIAYIYVGKVQR